MSCAGWDSLISILTKGPHLDATTIDSENISGVPVLVLSYSIVDNLYGLPLPLF